MKKILIILTIVALAGCITNKNTTNDNVNETTNSKLNDPVSIFNLMNNKTNSMDLPDQKRINIIFYILQNTKEISIHQMRGETDNVVMVSKDGREAVYDGNGELVTNPYNKGSYNLFDYSVEPIKKFLSDTLPWFRWGNDPLDPTSETERFYYYTFDLNIGLQKYIFEGRKTDIKNIDINSLSEDEKNVFKLFNYIIFNDQYDILFSDSNMNKLEKDGSFYWNYFYQIHELFGILQE